MVKSTVKIDVLIKNKQALLLRSRDSYFDQPEFLGDFNGDGIDDFVLPAPLIDNSVPSNSTSYIIYGNRKNLPDLNNFDSKSGILIMSPSCEYVLDKVGDDYNYSEGTIFRNGHLTSPAGDFNNDGYDDLLVSIPYLNDNKGIFYIIFGGNNNTSNIYLDSGKNDYGITIYASKTTTRRTSAQTIGDFNSDDFDDIAIYENDTPTITVIYGRSNISDIYLDSLASTDGFRIKTSNPNSTDFSYGRTFDNVGDINGDNYPELAVCESNYEDDDDDGASKLFVIYGSNRTNDIDLNNFNSSIGFNITGFKSETKVRGLGDINGDKIPDILIGSHNESPHSRRYAGEAFIILGGNKTLEGFDIKDIGNRGFSIISATSDDEIGEMICRGLDVNNDGINDILIGSHSKKTYIVFGSSNISDIDLRVNSDKFISIELDSYGQVDAINSVGDFNKDGYDDFIIAYEVYSQGKYNEYLIYDLYNTSIFITEAPTVVPSLIATKEPSVVPTIITTVMHSVFPSFSPSTLPTPKPSFSPSAQPTFKPSFKPTFKPTYAPTTKTPTFKPSLKPTSATPTQKLSSYIPTIAPTFDRDNLPPYIINLSNKDLRNVEESNDLIFPIEIGDFNKDGLKDYFIYGQNGNNAGPVVTVGKIAFSKSTSFLDNLKNDINSENLIKLTYSSISNFYPAVSGIGDYNLDGFSDIAFCAYSIQTCYIIYGTSLLEDIYLPNLDSSKGFKIKDTSQTYTTGYFSIFGGALAGGFDFDKDGISDFAITDYSYNNFQGRVYVILGKSNLRTDIDLNLSPGQEGIVIFSGFIYYYVYKGYSGSSVVQAGSSVISLGDYNGDGYDDIGISSAASIYIVYGSSDTNGFSLDAIPSNRGFTYTGNYGDTTLPSPRVKNIGDFNGDGFQDIAICYGIYHAEGWSVESIGVTTKIILGNSLNNNSPSFEIPNACSSMPGMEIGSAAKVGDVNGDGYDDFFISKTKLLSIASTKYFLPSGYYYLIFGKSSVLNNINLDNFDSNQGVIFIDDNTYNVENFQTSLHSLGNAVSIGDLNEDGYKDFLLSSVSQTYLIYGRSYFSKSSEVSPSVKPSNLPSFFPTLYPTSQPIYLPTTEPSGIPTSPPSDEPDPVAIADKIYATFSREAYADPDHTPVLVAANGNGNRIPTGWSVLIDSESAGIWPSLGEEISGWNFFSKAYRNNGHTAVIIAFQGTESLYDIISQDLDLAKGLMPSYYNLVLKFVDYVIDNFHINKSIISFTGHSLGGFLAQLATATYNVPSIVFESPGAKRVIDSYYGNPNYFIKYSAEDIKDIIKCYNAAPNLINIASGDHFEDSVIRLFPVYDVFASTFTLQQHGMSEILQQFNGDGTPKISADMSDYWYFSGSYKNWPYFEATSLGDITAANNFLNSVFFENYNQNPYYWELYWDKLPNIDPNHLLMSTSYRLESISELLGFGSYIPVGEGLEKKGITINGDNSDNKFFGTTNYKDTMNGGNGNDEYWSFSGFDKIIDTGGRNNYYFYTHNMRGTTDITDSSKTGKINFINIGCSIGKTYKVNEASDTYTFFPQFDSSCNLNKYSSSKINHKNDVILLYKESGDLSISYNNNDRYNKYRDKILIRNFEEGDYEINLGEISQNTYVAVGNDSNDLFSCSIEQNSILAGLGGINKYIITLFNDKSCSIISNDRDSNIYKLFSEEKSRFLSDASKIEAISGVINLFGAKNTDVIDLSSIGLSSFNDLSFTSFGNDTVITLPGGMTMRLDTTQTFVATTDGVNLAFYNTTNNSYTTNLTDAGINITSIHNALNTIFLTQAPTEVPTMSPTLEDFEKHHVDDNNIMGSDSFIAGVTLSCVLLLGMSCVLYAYLSGIWPFVKNIATVTPNTEQDHNAALDFSVNNGYELVSKNNIEVAGAADINEIPL
jgi:pimeloyl-ACP methyl ester carboxylesterase